MSVNHVNYPGCYRPVMVEDHSNPQVTATVKRVNHEIKMNQTEIKVKFLEDTLTGTDLSKPERTALEGMLREAQREWAEMKREANVH